MSSVNENPLPDVKRLSNAASYHGLRMLAYFSVFAALDAWYEVSTLMLANALSIIAALIVGSYLSGIFHEWGHFVAARISKSRSPIVRKPKGTFMFGFDMTKNTSDQFLWMSLGGALGNLLLIALVYVLLPFDNFGRAALFAMVTGKLIAVVIFEGPIILRTYRGGDPQTELDKQLDNGALDKGQKAGYLATAFLWVLIA